MLTLKRVNKHLASLGYSERLEKGNGYFYFYSGNAAGFYSSSIPVYRLNQLTLQDIVESLEYMLSEYNKYRN